MRVKARSSGGLFFSQTRQGSGFIFAVEGTTAFVATNHHVIDDGRSVEVEIGDSSTYEALLLGWDADRDVAVLSICCSSDFVALKWAQFTPSEGDAVVAIGYPLSGTFDLTATIGEVIATDSLSLEHDLIPHSAPLNPGSSGGPLLTIPGGEVVGINTARGTEVLAFYAVPYQAIEGQIDDWRSKLVIAPTATSTPTPIQVRVSGTPMPVKSSREYPILFGVPAVVKGDDPTDHWLLTVVGIDANATDSVMQENRFNDPPADGNRFFIARIRVEYLGSGSSKFDADFRLRAVGEDAVVYKTFSDSCGVIPDKLEEREMFRGGQIEGNVCWEVSSDDINSLTMFVEPGLFDYSDFERVWLSLIRSPDRSDAVVAPDATPTPTITPSPTPTSTPAPTPGDTVVSKGVTFECERLKTAQRGASILGADYAYRYVASIMSLAALQLGRFQYYGSFDAQLALEECGE